MSGAPDSPSFAESFRFPVATPEARRDLLIGGTLLLLTLPGWILNMGHRLQVVSFVWRGERPHFRGFRPWRVAFLRGLLALTAIIIYLSPSLVLAAFAWLAWPGLAARFIAAAAGLMCGLGMFALPGGMTRNAVADDLSYLARPDRAFGAALAGGRRYLKAWLIAASAIALSFLGLAVGLVGFLYTSVWAWTVVGFAFTSALQDRRTDST
ncbi:MAG TPA: hypothetical protein VH561_07415 [Micromonosporaceae bacterium]